MSSPRRRRISLAKSAITSRPSRSIRNGRKNSPTRRTARASGNLRCARIPTSPPASSSRSPSTTRQKRIEICGKVVDDAEWQKVEEGVYTGFSQGGRYLKRWPIPTSPNSCATPRSRWRCRWSTTPVCLKRPSPWSRPTARPSCANSKSTAKARGGRARQDRRAAFQGRQGRASNRATICSLRSIRIAAPARIPWQPMSNRSRNYSPQAGERTAMLSTTAARLGKACQEP